MIYITDPDDDTTLSKGGAGTFDPEIGWRVRPSGEVSAFFRRKIGSQSHKLIIDKISRMLYWLWLYTSELVKPNKRFRIQLSYFRVLTYSFSLNSDFRLSVVKRFVASSWWFQIVRSLFKTELLIRCLHTEGPLWRNPCSSARSVSISMVTQLRSARTIPVFDVRWVCVVCFIDLLSTLIIIIQVCLQCNVFYYFEWQLFVDYFEFISTGFSPQVTLRTS